MRVLLLFLSLSAFSQISPEKITIARDSWGVPHIFAKTDAEVAYGLAWAHAEDDFATIQQTALAGKGMLGRYLGKKGAPIDYVVGLLNIRENAEKAKTSLTPEFLKVAEGYLAGLNRYAELHPEEVLVSHSFPISLEDYLSSILLSLSVISGADDVISAIYKGEMSQNESSVEGSNAFAIAPWKTIDGSAFLAVNSHQPLEGPVAWYEAHLHSEEGWNMLGGLFPGGCVIFHGTNENLGWAHTVNHQDKIDVYALTMKGKSRRKYLFDGQWLKLDKKKVKLRVKMGFLTLALSKKAFNSVYGPTIRTKNGTFSIRMGANQDVRGLEQWYRMNKAQNFSQFYSAMEMVAIPGFNTVYADKHDTIFYVSNGKIPIRKPGYNWKGVLPGNTSETLWQTYHPLKDLPQYLNPTSGYLYNTNNTVFHASANEDNLNPEDYDQTMGYPLADNNRSMRFKELIETYRKLDYAAFKKIKYDGVYPDKFYFPVNINALMEMNPEDYPELKNELEVLQGWDRNSNIESRGAALFSGLLYKINDKGLAKQEVLSPSELEGLLTEVKHDYTEAFGSTNVSLGEVQKLVRGKQEYPIWGLPDVITAMYTSPYQNGIRKGIAGESYIQLVRYKKGELPHIESVINYGASNRPESKHYADQMPLFLEMKTKPMTLDKKEVLQHAEEIYSPE